jgi:CheY-like chemotaxis protein
MLPASRWHTVESADGFDAVEKASAHRPDLILLDVELPVLNGLEVAREILALNQDAVILFVSSHHSIEIAGAALGTGARGYVLKSHAGHELRPAMDIVLASRRFVTPTLGGRTVETIHAEGPFHRAVFYSNDEGRFDDYVRCAEAAFAAGRTFVFLADESARRELDQRLRARLANFDEAFARRCMLLDALQLLSEYLVDGWPDEPRLWSNLGSLLMRAAAASDKGRAGVVVCDESAASLVKDGRAEAAIRVEELWDDLGRTFNVEIVCGHPNRQR